MELVKNKLYSIDGEVYEYLGYYIDYFDSTTHVFKPKETCCSNSYSVCTYSDYDESILIKKFKLSKTELVRVINGRFFDRIDIEEVENVF